MYVKTLQNFYIKFKNLGPGYIFPKGKFETKILKYGGFKIISIRKCALKIIANKIYSPPHKV